MPAISTRPKRRRRHTWLRRILIGSSILLLVTVVGVLAVLAWAWRSMELPPDKPPLQTTFILDSNGDRLASFAGENRVPVKLNEVPASVRQAILDTEDHNYFQHRGVDPRGVARALLNDLQNKSNLQGGSTITQQYVKNVYVGNKRTPVRKFKEAILALKLERKYSKDEILERYLNVIYFGRGSYGVETASKAYFNKDVKQLDLREAAYLAGLIRAPENADAYASAQVATDRRDSTLESMVRFGSITTEQQAQVRGQSLQSYVIPKTKTEPAIAHGDVGTQYFVEYVRDQLIKKYGERTVLGGGLRVKTTLDVSMQTAGYNSIYGFLKPGEPAGALVSIDQSGAIKAMVGGRDWSTSKVNLATGKDGGGSGRQPGSTFKPIVLAAALEKGISIRDTYPGPGKLVVKGWSSNNTPVHNYGNEGFGDIDLIDATVDSVNTVYAQLAMDVGIGNIKKMAKDLGVNTNLPDAPSIALGAGEVSPLEMADVYLTFAQRGVHVTPTAISEVRDAKGDLLERSKPQRTRVMTEHNADILNYTLGQVMQRGTGTRAQFGKPAAGKTGTTEDNRDAWFSGYTPNLATSVWMGFPEGSSHLMTRVRGIAVTGGTFPAQMWSTYMRQATKNDEAVHFETPDLPPSKVIIPETTTTTTLVPPESTTTTAQALTPIPQTTTTTTTTTAVGDRPNFPPNKPGRGGGRTDDPPITIEVPQTFPGRRDNSATQMDFLSVS